MDSAVTGTSSPSRQVMLASNAEMIPLPAQEPLAKTADKKVDDYLDIDDPGKESAEEKPTIADPLEPFNRAMFQFNDKMYFWVLKPVAQGYNKVVPQPARIGVSNAFTNFAFPVRFVNCLLQANFKGAAEELGRFFINTVWGVGGLMDPASSQEINLAKRHEDFGQTLGVYGVGQGIYINWPFLGPSSPRDTVGMVGDVFLYPTLYLNPWYAWWGARGYEKVNDVSLKIGDYEAIKDAAIDPYVAVRDAYVQYRYKMIKPKIIKFSPDDLSIQKK